MNPLDNIKVVLVGTLYTGNVGSACRAMANMGFRHLVLAAPNLQNSWDEGERMAVHATDIMHDRVETATFEEAVADCGPWPTAWRWWALPRATGFTAST